MSEIKAIETSYKGYRFRSRTEARWAVFFDELGIDWRYEVEGFELDDGTRYLPDFWLPTFHGGMWVEVKSGVGDFTKAEAFAKQSNEWMWYAAGQPGCATYECERRDDFMPGCVPNASEALGENRMYWWAHPEFVDIWSALTPREQFERWLTECAPNVLRARDVARSARFEFGEGGTR